MSDVPLPADWFESHVMDAADPLWQWRVHSDRVVLSPEAASLLEGGTAGSYRGGSAAFCAGLAAGRQEGVRQLFGTLRRSSGSALEILQAVGGDIICCRAIVLERFPCGTPRLLVGALTRLDGSRKDFLACGTLVGHDDSGTPVYVTGNLVPRGRRAGGPFQQKLRDLPHGPVRQR